MGAGVIATIKRHEAASLVFPLDRVTSGYLDAIRALAAFVVVLNHWRAMFFVDYHDLARELHSPLVIGFLAAGKFGHQAVMIFFVLSGFLISSSIVRKIERGSWSWKDYAIDRSARLYMVLIPGLILGGIWDFLGLHLAAGRALYTAPLRAFGPHIPAAFLNAWTFAGNALFLQTRFVGVFGSNGPLWSLFNEAWYYVLFPAFVCAVLSVKRRKVAKFVAYLILAAGVTWLLADAMTGFLIWLAGFVVAIAANRWQIGNKKFKSIYIAVSAALFFGSLVEAGLGSTQFGNDICVGLSFALLLHALLQTRVDPGDSSLAAARTFSGFSYSLYLVHFPFLLFIRALILPKAIWQPDLKHILLASFILPVVLAYAYGVAHLTERHTGEVRSWIHKRISKIAATGHALSNGDAKDCIAASTE